MLKEDKICKEAVCHKYNWNANKPIIWRQDAPKLCVFLSIRTTAHPLTVQTIFSDSSKTPSLYEQSFRCPFKCRETFEAPR